MLIRATAIKTKVRKKGTTVVAGAVSSWCYKTEYKHRYSTSTEQAHFKTLVC